MDSPRHLVGCSLALLLLFTLQTREASMAEASPPAAAAGLMSGPEEAPQASASEVLGPGAVGARGGDPLEQCLLAMQP